MRSDLHGYNLKQKIKGAKPVGEADFEKLIGDLDESISGSESSESDEEENDEDRSRPKDVPDPAVVEPIDHERGYQPDVDKKHDMPCPAG